MGLIITRHRFVELPLRMARDVCAESAFKEKEVLLLR